MERLARRPVRLSRKPAEPTTLEPPALPPMAQFSQRGQAQVIYGASIQNLPLAGLNVAQAREAATAILRVDAEAVVLINGVPSDDDTVIRDSDVIEFIHRSGEKGSLR